MEQRHAHHLLPAVTHQRHAWLQVVAQQPQRLDRFAQVVQAEDLARSGREVGEVVGGEPEGGDVGFGED